MASSPVAIGEVFAEKYRVDRILGEGGMGIVVAAFHLELEQPVAIKFLLDDLATSDEGAERFRREARAAAKIQSDHVVRVLDVGVLESGERYMVMEYMEGRDLCEELAEKGTFPIGVAAGFILEAIDAVGHAHAVGIVHRDLKPANLFLARRADGTQRVKVLDFGISKSIGSATTEEMSLTKTSAWIGSPLYMAPEQMQSARDVDHRADIWSLGAILFELITGNPPYEAESLPQLCNLLITTDPPDIRSIVPSIPDGLAAAVMGCLVRDRDERTQSTKELAQALVKYATTTTGSSIRQSLLDRTEVQMSAPPSLAAQPPAGGAVGGATAQNATNAAWGATEDGKEKSSGGKMGLIAAAVVIAGAVGFFFLTSGGGEVEPEEESPVAAGKGPGAEADSQEVEAVEEEPSAEEAEPEPEPEPEKVAEPAPEPAPAPAPAQKVATPKQPKPRPKPRPSPKKTDDFADFGGRR